MKTAGLVLAAGAARRMGRAKADLPWRKSTYLTSIVERLHLAGCYRVYIVVGAHIPDTSNLTPNTFTLVTNHHWQKGMRSSIRAGLEEIDAPSVCVQPVDVPGVRVETIRQLIRYQFEGATIPVYKGTYGHPVLIDNAIQRHLKQPGQESLREMIKAHTVHEVVVGDSNVLGNINTMTDHETFVRSQS